MAVTTSSDLHHIDQLASTAVDTTFKENILLKAPGLVVDLRGRIPFAGGERISVPFWNTVRDDMVQDLPRHTRVGVPPSKLSLTSFDVDALSKIISIDIDEMSARDASEDVVAYMGRLVAEEFGAEIQGKIIEYTEDAAAEEDSPILSYTTAAGGLTIDGILDARMKWGEAAGRISPAYLFASTDAITSLMKSTDYKQIAGSGNQTIAVQSGDWANHVVTSIHGVQVVLLDQLPAGVAYLVGPSAWAVWVADQPKTDVHGHPGSGLYTWDSKFRYGAAVLPHTPRRIVRIEVTE